MWLWEGFGSSFYQVEYNRKALSSSQSPCHWLCCCCRFCCCCCSSSFSSLLPSPPPYSIPPPPLPLLPPSPTPPPFTPILLLLLPLVYFLFQNHRNIEIHWKNERWDEIKKRKTRDIIKTYCSKDSLTESPTSHSRTQTETQREREGGEKHTHSEGTWPCG